MNSFVGRWFGLAQSNPTDDSKAITLSSGGSESGSGSEDVIPGKRSTTQNAENDGGSKETIQDDAEADEDDEGEEEELCVSRRFLPLFSVSPTLTQSKFQLRSGRDSRPPI